LTAGLISATGNVTGGNILGGANVNATTHTGTTASLSGNVTGGNILTAGFVSATGNVTGNFFIGNGSLLTGITAASSYGNANVATFLAAFGSNTVVTTGNITGGNILGGANVNATTHTGTTVSVTGNITGGNILGGANVNATTHTGTTVSVTGNITGGNILGGANVNATTHTGTTVSVTGNVTGGNVVTGGLVSATSNVTGGNIRTSGLISATGNITGGNISTTGMIIGASQLIINSPSPSLEGGQLTLAWANISGLTGQANSTWNIDVDGAAANNLRIFYQNAAGATAVPITISSTTNAVSMIGSLSVNSGSAATAIVNGASNAVGNIGSSSTYFNRLFAQATTALYADLAEVYKSDAEYPPGTVLIFGGNQEVTVSTTSHDTRIAGVVSTNPAHVMNSGLVSEYTVDVGLIGRVPCQVTGPVAAGDRLVSSNQAGVAERLDMQHYQPGVIIGKAVESHNGTGIGTIEVVVGRL